MYAKLLISHMSLCLSYFYVLTLSWSHHLFPQLPQSGLLFLPKQTSDGGLDALLLWLFMEGVLTAGYTAQSTGLCL